MILDLEAHLNWEKTQISERNRKHWLEMAILHLDKCFALESPKQNSKIERLEMMWRLSPHSEF